jgi:hypothetical protein
VIPSSRERSANRALVFGLLAMPFGIFAPFAIWAGVASLRNIRSSDGELSGALSARVGIVGGIFGLAVLLLGTAYWFFAT